MLQEWKAKRSALLGRISFVGGSFFDAATLPAPEPAGRDVYMLRCVLHDWKDAKTVEILRSLRTAMGGQSVMLSGSAAQAQLSGPCCATSPRVIIELSSAAGPSTNATLVLVEVIPHSDLAHEDIAARQMLDVQMLVVVDGKERSRVNG